MPHELPFARAISAEADPTNREIAKELQVCMERSAASGDVLEYRHGYADERHGPQWAVAKSNYAMLA